MAEKIENLKIYKTIRPVYSMTYNVQTVLCVVGKEAH